jgi:hypothetical protein
MPDTITVTPETILSHAGEVGRLSKLQQVGVVGALVTGSLAALVLLVLLFRWMHLDPNPPSLVNLSDGEASAVIARYKELQGLELDSTGRMIDAIVVKILLPIFTSFVGFVFGTRASR